MSDWIDVVLLPFIWVLNGAIAVAFAALDHLPLVVLPGLFAVLYVQSGQLAGGQARHVRAMLFVTGGLAAAAVQLAPQPAPYLLLGLMGAGLAAVHFERYRPDEVLWDVLQNVILYALVGLGARVLLWMLNSDMSSAGLYASGVNYLTMLTGFALWGMPVAKGGLLIKNLLAHAPAGSDPQTIISKARERRP